MKSVFEFAVYWPLLIHLIVIACLLLQYHFPNYNCSHSKIKEFISFVMLNQFWNYLRICTVECVLIEATTEKLRLFY